MIYAIRIHGTEFVKIGVARDVRRRVSAIATSMPFKIDQLAVADWPNAEEKRIHHYLASYRIRGEWFYMTYKTSTVIDLLRANDLQAWLTTVSTGGTQGHRLGKAASLQYNELQA